MSKPGLEFGDLSSGGKPSLKAGENPAVARGTDDEDLLHGPRGMDGGFLTAVLLKRCRLGVGDGGELENYLNKKKNLQRSS